MKKIFVVLMLVSGLFLISCDDDDDNATGPQAPQTGNVLVVHASPDAPAVDLLVDGATAGSGLAFPNNTGYLAVNAGTRNIKVNVSGSTPALTVIDTPFPIEADKNYTIFAIDSVANLSVLPIEDDLSAPAAGKAHVRFAHLSPNAPAVDITDTAGNIVFGDYEFAENSAFTPLDAGTYDLEVRAAGTSTVVLSLGSITLEDGKIYTVWAKGFLGGTGAQALGAEIIVNN